MPLQLPPTVKEPSPSAHPSAAAMIITEGTVKRPNPTLCPFDQHKASLLFQAGMNIPRGFKIRETPMIQAFIYPLPP